MQLWYDAVESEQYSLLRVWESYEAAYVSYFADKELISIPASGATVSDPFPFRLRLEVYNLTLDAG